MHQKGLTNAPATPQLLLPHHLQVLQAGGGPALCERPGAAASRALVRPQYGALVFVQSTHFLTLSFRRSEAFCLQLDCVTTCVDAPRGVPPVARAYDARVALTAPSLS